LNTSLVNKEFRNILIIKPSSLGDVVRTLPILVGLDQRYPHARISWLVRPDCAGVLEDSPHLDEILLFDRKHYGRIGRSLLATRDFIRFCSMLRRKEFDLVLDIQGLFRSAFMSLCTMAPVRLGFARAREFAPCFYTHRVVIGRQAEHVVESTWHFAQRLGFGHLPKRFNVVIDEASRQSAFAILEKNGVPPSQDYFVFLIGGTSAAKQWPMEQFARLAEVCKTRYDRSVVLLGAGEAALAQTMLQHSRVEICNLVNQTRLKEAIALLHQANLVVGNDSGPLHIAAALGKPTIGLYGPTNPQVVGPYGQMDGVVQVGKNLVRNGRYSNHELHRIGNITVEMVEEKIAEKLI
jgi:lipopolysaccharide heptosyltransferase I